MIKQTIIAYFVLLVFCSFSCCALQFSKEAHSNVVECNQYFHGKPWPQLKNTSNQHLVRLCQSKQGYDSSIMLERAEKPITFYATLFDTYRRTPLYSANVVQLSARMPNYSRPAAYLWKRVAAGLCHISIPQTAIYSDITFVNASTLESCKNLQAIEADYYRNNMNLDRGHLSPSHINCRNKAKNVATFTLTNAAPQYARFNRYSWKDYELHIEKLIRKLAPEEPVYILTGISGSALDKNGKEIWLFGNTTKKRVKVPGYYWKAVCYPGNEKLNKTAWGFAYVKKNIDKVLSPNYKSYITLKKFAQKYFKDPPFGPKCMNVGSII